MIPSPLAPRSSILRFLCALCGSALTWLFGCTHRRTTFPRCRKDRLGRPIHPARNYVACLDCGAQLDYHGLDVSRSPNPSRLAASPEAEL